MSSKLHFATLSLRCAVAIESTSPVRPTSVTGSVVNWLPIFTTAARCDILLESLAYCRQEKTLQIYAWVILDTHFHAILAATDLARVLDLKRRTARRLIEQLEAESCTWLLRHARLAHKTESTRQIWQEGSHPQAMMSDAMMGQKLEYLHNNPLKRSLVASPEHWRYSSAHEWLPGANPVLKVDRWR